MQVENVNIESGNWSVEVNNNVIRVENKFSTLKLYVNEKLQDVYLGMVSFQPRLTGKLPNGEEVKVVVGGDFKIHCYIFVDNELVLED